MARVTFLEGLGELGASREGLAPLVNAGLQDGMSGNQMLQQLRSVGMGIRTQDFYRLVGEVRASISMDNEWAGMPLDVVPPPNLALDWTGGKADTYLYRVKVFFRDMAGDENATGHLDWSHQSDSLIAPQEALDAIAQQMTDNSASDNYSHQQVTGMILTGVYHQTGFR